nr:MAG TPA: hypothetical protein [Ackermannviridae sp.]
MFNLLVLRDFLRSMYLYKYELIDYQGIYSFLHIVNECLCI